MDDRLLAFIAVSIAVVVIPGPDMALVARNVLRHGRSAGLATSVGICTGVLGWVFFLTLLPQFIAPGDPPAARALQLAAVFEVIGLGWLVTYTLMLSALGAVLGRPGPRRVMRWVTGTVLVALGARVALERT